MLEDVIAIASQAVAANAETATEAETRVTNLRRTLDNSGRTIREGGKFTMLIGQNSTKEFPSGVRTSIRIDREANGNIPASSAFVVITGSDTAPGRDSMVKATEALISMLGSLGVGVSSITGDDDVPWIESATTTTLWRDGISQIIRGEA